jgi:hypothetical protein
MYPVINVLSGHQKLTAYGRKLATALGSPQDFIDRGETICDWMLSFWELRSGCVVDLVMGWWRGCAPLPRRLRALSARVSVRR